MRNSSHSIWLTGVILLTIASFLAVFKPLTFAPRKDPSDASKYLRPLMAKDFDASTPPKPFTSLSNKVNLYLYEPQHDLKLGLDLRGGMRVVLQVPDRAEFTYALSTPLSGSTVAAAKQTELVDALAADGALGKDATDPAKTQVTVTENQVQVITQAANASEAEHQLSVVNAAMAAVLPVDQYNYKLPSAKNVFKPATDKDLESVRNIMEKRLNGTGTSEVNAYTKQPNQVVLEIPGVKEPDRVRELLRTTAQLQFRLIPQDMQVFTDDTTGEVSGSRAGAPLSEKDIINGSYLVLNGSALKPNSTVTSDPKAAGKMAVTFEVNDPKEKLRFGAFTGANVGRQLAIVLDNKLVMAPVIQDRLPGNGIITGNFDAQEARDLSVLLNAGALPVPVQIVENRIVSATLGADSVALSIKAGLIGLVAVLVFMAAYYRLPGLMANMALAVYVLLSLAVLWLFGATLTLPGIAGIIISIGMAVDANVIIFERLKEELRTKKPLETAIDVAFSRAWTAILDSNVASLITGSVLYALGTGAIRGFAVTLMIGVAVSMFTAVTVTRLFMKLMIRSKAGHNLAWYGV